MLDGQYVTVTEAAEELGLSRQRVHRLIQGGQLPAEQVHDRLLVIPRSDLDRFKRVDRPNGLHIERRIQAKPKAKPTKKR